MFYMKKPIANIGIPIHIATKEFGSCFAISITMPRRIAAIGERVKKMNPVGSFVRRFLYRFSLGVVLVFTSVSFILVSFNMA